MCLSNLIIYVFKRALFFKDSPVILLHALVIFCSMWPQERRQTLFYPLTEIMHLKFEYNLNIDHIQIELFSHFDSPNVNRAHPGLRYRSAAT